MLALLPGVHPLQTDSAILPAMSDLVNPQIQRVVPLDSAFSFPTCLKYDFHSDRVAGEGFLSPLYQLRLQSWGEQAIRAERFQAVYAASPSLLTSFVYNSHPNQT
jgi:hypothetical protein